ncbi:MAG: hypothetical protein HZA35_00640 [Parcubacteria group bacterium]|nr:hypothetical protein [Parcubacteria group bacterium]
MFEKRPITDCSIQFPISLRNTSLFDANGNVYHIEEKREKILKLLPTSTLTLTKHSTTKLFVTTQVQRVVDNAMHLWREQHALPTLSTVAPQAESYLHECAQDAKRSCTKNLLETLGTEGMHCFEEIVKELLVDMETFIAKKMAYTKEIEEQSPQLLPPGTRFHWHLTSRDTHYQIFCIENPPQQRTIHILEETRRLALPWIYFIVVFHDVGLFSLYAFYRNTPLTSLDDTLYFPNLPNISPVGFECCLGPGRPYISLKNKHWSEALFTYFWGSSFRNDGSSYIDFYRETEKRIPELKDLDTWENISNENPLFVLGLPWKEMSTLRTFIERLSTDFEITTKIAAAKATLQKLWQNIEERYVTEFANTLTERLHARCSQASPEINISHIAHERLVALFKEIERELTTTLHEVHTPISEALSISMAQAMIPYARGK